MKRGLFTAVGTVLVVVIAAAAVLVFGSAATVTLVADGPIEVLDKASADPSQTQVIGKLAQGEEVAVVSCKDLKHYVAPEVVLRDGRKGFVLVGNFHLLHEPPWSSPGKPTALGCGGE
jgi:hypothetical protein